MQGDGGVYSEYWGNHRGGGQSRCLLTPEVDVTIGGDCLPKVFCGVIAFQQYREIILACPDYEQQMGIIFEFIGDKVLAGKRELLDSETHVMVADEVYDDKAAVDLSAEELTKALKAFAAVDVLMTSDEVFCR